MKKVFLLLCMTYLAGGMIISPHRAVFAAKTALTLCANVVIPSLFPFIFCANMFIALGAASYARRFLSAVMHPVFGVSGAGAAAFFLGIISGYPVGAVCAAEMYLKGEVTKGEAERLAAFCNNSGPMFVIGAVGASTFGNQRIGILLYIVHILSAVLCGVIIKYLFGDNGFDLSKNGKCLYPSYDRLDLKYTAADIGAAVSKSVETILMICGYVVIFAVITASVPDCKIKPYVYSVLEITGGISALCGACGGKELLILTAMAISFSGISVFAQVSSVLAKAKLSSFPYLVGKVIQAVVSAALMYFAIRLNFGNVPAFNDIKKSGASVLSKAAPLDCLSVSVQMISIGIVLCIAFCAAIKACRFIKRLYFKIRF